MVTKDRTLVHEALLVLDSDVLKGDWRRGRDEDRPEGGQDHGQILPTPTAKASPGSVVKVGAVFGLRPYTV